MNKYYVYIATNKTNRVLYTGITNDIQRRMQEHKEKLVEGFSKKYNVSKLVYFYEFDGPDTAIEYEKKIKGWLRRKKIELIEEVNPEWIDLSGGL